MAHGGFHHAVGKRHALIQILGERAGIDADPDGDVSFFSGFYDGFGAFASADIAGIQSEGIYSAFDGGEGQSVIEVDIGNERDTDLFSDIGKSFSGLFIGYRKTDDLASGFFQFPDASDSRFDVAGIGLGHGLYGDWCITADKNVTDM
jgi:hypothetical protein